MSPEDHLALAKIDPELEEILKVSPVAKGFDSTSNIPEIRKAFLAAKKQSLLANSTADTNYVEEDRKIQVRDGSSITVRIHSPKNPPKDGSPIFVMYHGGGFCFGGLDNETPLCREFTALGGVAVNVDYRLAPENPFPVPVHDAYDALKWTAEHFEELGGNPKKGFLIGGISAGANLASVLSLQYIDDKISPPLTGTYLSIPACIEPGLVPEKYKNVYLSREQNSNAPILNAENMHLFNTFYKQDLASPLCSPLLNKSHKDLPPTYFQICGMDPLRDEGLIYEEILRAEYGHKTRVDIYPGLPHGFWSWWRGAKFTKKYEKDCIAVAAYRTNRVPYRRSKDFKIVHEQQQHNVPALSLLATQDQVTGVIGLSLMISSPAMVNPQAILITDEGITEPANATVLEMVLSYVKNGGRAIFGLHFTSFINMDSFNKLFHEVFGLPWQRGDYHRATFRFNPSCTLPAGTVKNSMRFDYSMKVLHIMGAASHEKIFVPVPGGMTQSAVFPPSHVDESQAAVVGAKIGDGFLAYCGDVNAEAGSDKVILALCVL